MLHSKVGNTLFVVFFILLLSFVNWRQSILLSLSLVLLIGLCKELYDKYYKKTLIDWWDIVASITPYFIVKKINK